MSDEPNGNASGGGWEPIPQSEGYDGDATAFVQLPPEFMLDGVPLEAPGHGYVPPMIVPLTPLTPAAGTDPAATGQWVVQVPTAAETTAPDAPEQHAPAQHGDPDPHATGQWSFTESTEPDPHTTGGWSFEPAQSPDPSPTGQWTIPVVTEGSDTSDESGEYTASMLAQYASSAPATLPGGAPAPWAVQEPAPTEATEATEADGAAPAADGEPGPFTGGSAASEALDSAGISGNPEAPETHEAPDGAGVTEAQEHHETYEAHGALGAHVVAEVHEAPEAHGVAEAPEAAEVHEAPLAHEAHEAPQAHEAHEAAEAHDAPHAPDAPPVTGVSYDTDGAEAPVLPTGTSADSDEHPHISYVLRVNGADRPVTESWIGESLLYVLRERLGLAGAKDGCSQGECGACNVQVDGRLVASCLVPAATAAGSEVRTVEGLATDGEPSDVQRALARCGAVQCGFCVPGMAMTVHDLLEGNHAPTELETRQALCGNLCRCSGYRGVLDAVREVVAERDAQAAASADEARIPHQIPHPHDGGTA